MSLVPVYSQEVAPTKRHKSARWLARQFERGTSHLDLGIAQATDQPEEAFKDFEEALRLVHGVYVKKKYISATPSSLHLSLFQLLPRSRSFIAKEAGQVVATISVVFDSPLGLPIDRLYPEAMAELRQAALLADEESASNARTFWDSPNLELLDRFVRLPGPRIAEVTAFALDERYLAHSPSSDAVYLELMRKAHQYSVVVGVTNYVIEVTPNHAPFYERFWGFQTFASGRVFPSDQAPAVAMKNSPMELNRFFAETDRMIGGMGSLLRLEDRERQVIASALPVPMLPPDGLKYFLQKRFHPDEPALWERATLAEREAFQAAYAPFGYDFSWGEPEQTPGHRLTTPLASALPA
jgi:hypothetical protein